jgi:Ca2+-binding EF-hand superfamily protein
MKPINLIIGLGILAICLPVFAGEDTQKEKFDSMDENKDGSISVNEATGQTEILRNWVNIDKNVDGKLEYSEFSAFETMKEKAKGYEPPYNDESPEPGAAPY